MESQTNKNITTSNFRLVDPSDPPSDLSLPNVNLPMRQKKRKHLKFQ